MEKEKCGVFIRKVKFVQAMQVTDDWEEYIDRNGERFLGLRGDFKLFDDSGNIYYINKHEFLLDWAPFNEVAWKIISDWRDSQIEKRKLALQGRKEKEE